MSQDAQLRIISALVEHKPGVLYRISNLIRRKSFNIESIAVGPAEIPGLARMTFTMFSDYSRFDQVMKNIDNLIDIRSVEPLEEGNATVRELALVKFSPGPPVTRLEVMSLIETFRANIVDLSPETLTVEISGDSDKINAFIDLARNFGVKKVAAGGHAASSVACRRGAALTTGQ